VNELDRIFGPDGEGIVRSGDPAQDRERAQEFATHAHEKMSISVDRKGGDRAFILVGQNDWPFPVPLVKHAGKWSFDAKAGSQEILYRRIGDNELDAINICRGYVEAQREFAHQKREGYAVHQYAQHGYFFKVLKGQGPADPFGAIDFVVKGVMIGGFALVAAPAEYRKTGVKTFIVSHHGVVYEKDLGPNTLDEFKKMELFNPDKSWKPVKDDTQYTQVKTSSVDHTG